MIASGSKTLTAALVPSQILNVRVTYADTGQPVPHAPLQVRASRGSVSWSTSPRPTPREKLASTLTRRTAPTASMPILRKASRISLPTAVSSGPRARSSRPSTSPCRVGVLVHGRVTEEGSGKPIAGAMVDFEIRRELNGNNHNRTLHVYTQPDGSFHLGAEPERGPPLCQGSGR